MSEKDVLRKPVISRPVPWDEVSSFVCYYGDFKEEMALFDVAILEPSKIPPDKITWLRSHGTYTIAYIYQDIASDISFEKRNDLMKLVDEVNSGKVERVVVSYKDRLSRVG